AFAPASIGTNDAAVLTITLTNPNATAATGVAFTDTYPASLVNTASASGATTCGGTVTAANNGTGVALSGAPVPAAGAGTAAGHVNAAAASAATTCGGTLTAPNNGTSVALSGGTIPASGSCTVTVNVTSAAAGSYNNSTGAIATANAGSTAAASATLTVLDS